MSHFEPERTTGATAPDRSALHDSMFGGTRAAGASASVGVAVRPRDVPALDDSDLIRTLVAVEAQGRRIDALRVALAGEVAERSRRELGADRLSTALGCRSAAEVVQRATGISGVTAGRRIRLGRSTRVGTGPSGACLPAQFDEVAAALHAGILGTDAACAIVDVLGPTARTATAAQVAAAETELVGAARCADADAPPPVDADTVRLQATVWASFLDPDGTAPDERDAARRHLDLRAPRHGLVPVSGLLLPEVAAALRAYADACTNPRGSGVDDPTSTATSTLDLCTADVIDPGSTNDQPTGADTVGADAVGTDAVGTDAVGTDAVGTDAVGTDERSPGQRLHDVLATIVHVAARAADAPTVAGNAPTVVVAVRAEDLEAGTGLAFADDSRAPLSVSAARHLACAGAVQRVALDRAGSVVGLWSPQRCFTGHQRRAIALRDGGCVIPGCSVPAAWCEVHHVVPHAQDPDGTETDNGVLLCWHHHRTIDTSGWELRMEGGVPHVRPPGWLDHRRPWRPARGSPVRLRHLLESQRRHSTATAGP